jgi:hypothetical protein
MADERKTPVFDWETMDFKLGIGGVVQLATGIEAAAQVIQKAENTQLGKYSVYGDLEDLTRNHIYGSRVHDVLVRQDLPEAVKLSEIEREAVEAIIYDPWVNEVTEVKAYKETDRDGVIRTYLYLVVDTVFGSVSLEGVEL